jgi:putative transposase
MSFLNIHAHLVWSTAQREKLILPEWQPRLYAYLAGIAKRDRVQLLAVGGMADHVHCLVRMPATINYADLVNHLKSNSTKWIRESIPNGKRFRWQKEYGGFAVCQSGLARTERYIRNQEVHHRGRSYQEEFLLLLDKHGIEYDPRYLWLD